VGLEELCLCVLQSTFWGANAQEFYRLQKFISDNAYEHYDSPAVEEIVYRSRSINQLLTRTISRRRGRYVDC